jgi:hypothetical protein
MFLPLLINSSLNMFRNFSFYVFSFFVYVYMFVRPFGYVLNLFVLVSYMSLSQCFCFNKFLFRSVAKVS